MNNATMTVPVAVKSIIPAATSFAILASVLHSVVIKSVMASIAVFTISTPIPKTIVKIMMAISTWLICKIIPKMMAIAAKEKCILKLGWVRNDQIMPFQAFLIDI